MKRILASSPSAFAETIGAAFVGAAHDAVARARMLGVEVVDAPRAKAKRAKKAVKRAAKVPERAKGTRSKAASRAKARTRKKAATRKRA